MTRRNTRFDHIDDDAGVYAIICRANLKVYVGQTKDNGLGTRMRSHYNTLERGRHTNKLLQADWTRYGARAFEFCVLTTISAWRGEIPLPLLELERIFIHVYQSDQPEFGYNYRGKRR